MSVTPDELTGQQVMDYRKAYGLGRGEFAQMAGYPGPTRIFSIETKDSWKKGDREKIADLINHLSSNPPPTKRRKGESAEERVDRLEEKLRASGKLIRELDAQPAFYDDSDEAPTLTTDINKTDLERFEEWAHDRAAEPQDQQWRPLSNSEVSTWQRCRRKWWLAWYRELALKQQDFTGPRAIGNRVHRALAAWYVPDGVERIDPRVALEQAISDDWAVLAEQALTTMHSDPEAAMAQLATYFNDTVTLERAMVEGYVEWIAEGHDAHLKVVAPELPLYGRFEEEIAGEKVQIEGVGILDVQTKRTSDDVTLFIDHKTVGNFTEPRKTLHMDPQMLHYHLLEWFYNDGEQRCDGALYNMLRKVKRSQTAKPPFYDRVEVRHNSIEIESYRKRLLGVARDIQRAERDLNDGNDPLFIVYPNPTHQCSWDCDFFAICPMFDDGSRVEDAITSLYHRVNPMDRYARYKTEE